MRLSFDKTKTKRMSADHPSPTKKARKEKSQLDQLKEFTVVVADTGEVGAIKAFSPQDATTNPSLIFKAASLPEYHALMRDAVEYAHQRHDHPSLLEQAAELVSEAVDLVTGHHHISPTTLDLAMDRLAVNFGTEISKIVPGYISTEVDARLSFDTAATVQRARRIIDMYREKGVDKSRILIKIASTYEGIRAGEILEREGITCNLTLLFSMIQAAACAEAGITLISPFVGRIMDWYKAKTGKTYTGDEDPGVISVRDIYAYLKKHRYETIVMGASFRNTGEIIALAGCDRLTIAPSLLEELAASTEPISRVLVPPVAPISPRSDEDEEEESASSPTSAPAKLDVHEAAFRYALNSDAMATEKLAEGIRSFSADLEKLEKLVVKLLQEKKLEEASNQL